MTFQEMQPYEGLTCRVYLTDGTALEGAIERRFDAASRPYFAIRHDDLDPCRVRSITPLEGLGAPADPHSSNPDMGSAWDVVYAYLLDEERGRIRTNAQQRRLSIAISVIGAYRRSKKVAFADVLGVARPYLVAAYTETTRADASPSLVFQLTERIAEIISSLSLSAMDTSATNHRPRLR